MQYTEWTDNANILFPPQIEIFFNKPLCTKTGCIVIIIIYISADKGGLVISALLGLLTSPTYFWTSSDPMTRMKQASVLLATARAQRVFPVPGGPNRSTPFGGSIPRFTNLSGWNQQLIQSIITCYYCQSLSITNVNHYQYCQTLSVNHSANITYIN